MYNNVAIYMRVNSKDQINRLNEQEKAIRAFSESKGYKISGIYKDVAPGAKNALSNRGLVSLLNNADNYDAVIVNDLSRISRNYYSFKSFESLLNQKNTKLISVKEAL